MKLTKEEAYSRFVDVAGNMYEYLAGPKTGRRTQAVGYEISKDAETLYFIMNDGSKIEYSNFEDIVLHIGDAAPVDTTFSGVVSGKVEQDKNDLDVISAKLGLMTEEEERAENERRLGIISNPNPTVLKKSDPNSNPEPQKHNIAETNEYYPIYVLLDKRKKKPNTTINVSVDFDFIDKNTFMLIDSTLDNSLDGVCQYFSDKIDFNKLKESFNESLKQYILDNFGVMDLYPDEEDLDDLVEDSKAPEPRLIKEGEIPKVSDSNLIVEDKTTSDNKKSKETTGKKSKV